MKISLNAGQENPTISKAAAAKNLEREILAAQKGDWTAKNSLAHSFLPLLKSLAEKRATDSGQINLCIEAGKKGLLQATKKYKPEMGAEGFQLMALDYIESAMGKATGDGRGILSRFFGKR